MDEEFIGICDDGRIVLKLPTLGMNLKNLSQIVSF
jgi:hypothetical protein